MCLYQVAIGKLIVGSKQPDLTGNIFIYFFHDKTMLVGLLASL